MRIIYEVDTSTKKVAVVIPTPEWLLEHTMEELVVKVVPIGVKRFATGFINLLPNPTVFAISGNKRSKPASASTIASTIDLPSFKLSLTVIVKKDRAAGTEPRVFSSPVAIGFPAL